MNPTGSGSLSWPAIKQAMATGGAVTGVPRSADPAPVTRGASAAGFVDGVNTRTTAVDTDNADGTEARFLKLLVAQMRNQDPLNPMDNAQVTSQLAQISTVRGIEGLGKTMSDFVAAGAQNAAFSSVGVLGKQVLVPGSGFRHEPSGDATTRIGFELDSEATAARIDLVDSRGRVVFTSTSRNLQPGMQTFEWDGRNLEGATVPAGPLSVQVMAVDGTTALDARTLVPARVVGISQTATGAMLELEGADAVAPSDVRVIL